MISAEHEAVLLCAMPAESTGNGLAVEVVEEIGKSKPPLCRPLCQARPRASRILAASPWTEDGFWMKRTPSSSTPRWAMTSSE